MGIQSIVLWAYRRVDLALNTMSLPCPRRGERRSLLIFCKDTNPIDYATVYIQYTHTHTHTHVVVRITGKRVNAVDATENDEQQVVFIANVSISRVI